MQYTLFGETGSDFTLTALPSNTVKIKANYNRINDAIDILNIKEQELGSNNDYGTMGDASGYTLTLGYGFNELITLYYDHDYLNVHYIDSTLKNKKHDLFAKINLYNNPNNRLFQSFSIDIGYLNNSADNLDIKKTSTLNSIAKKIRPGTNIVFDGQGIVFNGNGLYIFNEDGLRVPFLRLANLQDDSLYARVIADMNLPNSILHFYSGYKSTSIETAITLEPSDNEIIAAALDEFGSLNLKRDEKTLFAGFNYTYQYNTYLFEIGYEYLKIFDREKVLEATDNNHILTASISKQITHDLAIFIGGKAMLHQFNGVLPYLYNEYSKNQFDKKYGYVKLGFIYNFDLSNL